MAFKDKSNELQRQLFQQLMRALQSRQYSQLAIMIEVLAKANSDEEIVMQLNEIKENCTLDFEGEVMLFLKSFMMPSYYNVRFRGTGQKLSWKQVQDMGMKEIHEPLTKLCIDLMSKLGESREVSLRNIMLATSEALESAPRNEVAPQIIFDNEEDLQDQQLEEDSNVG